ncbi:DUF1573 domain-containing protein [Fulvivirgaceae bacterium LMO-SS25]
MEIIKLLSTILLIVLVLGCQENQNEQTDEIKSSFPEYKNNNELTTLKLVNSVVDFGNIPEDTTVFASYDIINTGENDLIISLVETDCTCTGYTLSDKTLMPGDTTILSLEFDSKGKLGQNTIYAILHANTKDKLHKVVLKNMVQ